MSVEIAWKQNILVTDFHLLKSLLVVFGFGSQAFVCGFSRQNINSVMSQKKVLNHFSDQILFSWIVLRGVIWRLFLDWSQSEKNILRISHLYYEAAGLLNLVRGHFKHLCTTSCTFSKALAFYSLCKAHH